MNEYQYKVCDTINDKLTDFAMNQAHSLYNIELMYKFYLKEYSLIYRDPHEHYSKIMAMAYNKTLKEYEQ